MKSLFAGQPEVLEDVLGGLFHIAKADGVIHPKELEYLQQVAKIFGFEEADFDRIRARHIGPDAGDPYVVLGIERTASDDEIKKAYRKLVAENHPDKVIARGVPEEFVAIATEKLAAINAAYDRIEKERGF
jgi:DnaJ like chaperone protein